VNTAEKRIVFLAIAAAAVAAVFYLSVLVYRVMHYGQFADRLFDDAFFFVRYAGNFLDTGAFEWNRGEGPVYGNTSQFYQLVVTLLHWLLDGNVVLTLFVALALGAAAYLVVLPLAYASARPRIDPAVRLVILALIVVCIAFDGQMLFAVENGMETTWAMALVSLSLLVTFRLENADNPIKAAALNGVAILLVFTVRPDAVLLAFAGPAGLVAFSRERALRRAGLTALLGGAMLVALFIGLCWLYYGDPLPLAAITKTSLLSILPAYRHFEDFGSSYRLLEQMLALHKAELCLALIALAMFSRLSPVLRGAALGMAAFSAYHLFFVVPIMAHAGRFYAPMVPVLTLLAASAAEAIVERIRQRRWSAWIGIAAVVAIGGLLAHRAVRLGQVMVLTHQHVVTMDDAMNTADGAMTRVSQTFRYYDGRMAALVAGLGEDCSIASTENGALSAFARRAPMVDISGLHDRRMAWEGFSATRLLEEQRPDVVIRPYPWYVDWIAALESHPALDRDYIREGPSAPGKIWIAFRRDSACAARVRKAVYGR